MIAPTAAAWWRGRCATCAHYVETAAFGAGVGRCERDRSSTGETDSCAHWSAPVTAQ